MCYEKEDVFQILTGLSLKEPDAGKHDKQLWSEEFGSVGLLPAFIKDMTVGGEIKMMWIAWYEEIVMTESIGYITGLMRRQNGINTCNELDMM